MKNYQNSDYALNKYSDGIVYRFADGIVEVTLERYLAENPGKTEEEFLALKELSDTIYLNQVRDENAQTKKNVCIHRMEDGIDFDSIPMDEEYLDKLDKLAAAKAFDALLADGKLTETQERRFCMHFFESLSFRDIADREGVALRAIQQSIDAATGKLKKYFNFF